MQERITRTHKSREGLYLALFAIAFVVGASVLTWFEVRHNTSDGLYETIKAIFRNMESYVVVSAAAIYIILEGGAMLAEKYLERRYREGREEGEDAMSSAIQQVAQRQGMDPEEVRRMIDEAREIVRNGNGRA